MSKQSLFKASGVILIFFMSSELEDKKNSSALDAGTNLCGKKVGALNYHD